MTQPSTPPLDPSILILYALFSEIGIAPKQFRSFGIQFQTKGVENNRECFQQESTLCTNSIQIMNVYACNGTNIFMR